MLQAFRDAPPARQLMIVGGLGIVLCAVLVAIYFLFLRTSYSVLYRDLREADAATIVAELDRTHADYRLADGGRSILVPEGSVDTTRLHVAGRDLPLQGTVGFELFNNSSIGLTEFAQRINLQRALQGELQRTIMSIDGVEAARVHLALGEQTPFRGDRRPPRASVTVRTAPGRSLAPTTVRGIQRLVAGSVPEMGAASVAVLNERGALVSGETPVETASGAGDSERRRIESFFEARIRHAVEQRFPADAIEVSVWAGLHEDGPPAANAAPVDPAAESRSYRLRATVAIAQGLSNQARALVTRAVEQAIGFDTAVGDSVSVTASAPLPDAGEPAANVSGYAPPAAAPREAPSESAGGSLLGGLWTPLLLLALIGAVALLVRRREHGGRMSEQQRLAHVAGLRTLLAERSADAAPPA
jgi:flagellar M-ring protein FliF